MDDLLADFLTETNENLAELDVALVRLETAPDDPTTLSGIFRLVHTIKGTCGFLGLPRLEQVAHAGENVLGRMRDGALRPTPVLVSLVLAALDRIKAIVAGLADDRHRTGRRRWRPDRRPRSRGAGARPRTRPRRAPMAGRRPWSPPRRPPRSCPPPPTPPRTATPGPPPPWPAARRPSASASMCWKT